MPVEAPPRTWIELYNGLELSAERLSGPDGKVFTIGDAAEMDIDAFNREAESDVRMKDSDVAYLKFLKYAESLSRRYGDGSFVPANREYTDTLLMAGVKLFEAESADQPHFWNLFSGERVVDVTRDVIKILDGKDHKYLVQVYRFDKEWKLRPAGPRIVIATNGWIRAIGALHGYPTEVSQECGPVRNTERYCVDPAITDGYVRLFMGTQSGRPESDDMQFVTRHPSPNTGALCMGFYSISCAEDDMGAILLRRR